MAPANRCPRCGLVGTSERAGRCEQCGAALASAAPARDPRAPTAPPKGRPPKGPPPLSAQPVPDDTPPLIIGPGSASYDRLFAVALPRQAAPSRDGREPRARGVSDLVAPPIGVRPDDAGRGLRDDAGRGLRDDAGRGLRDDAGRGLRDDAGRGLREVTGGDPGRLERRPEAARPGPSDGMSALVTRRAPNPPGHAPFREPFLDDPVLATRRGAPDAAVASSPEAAGLLSPVGTSSDLGVPSPTAAPAGRSLFVPVLASCGLVTLALVVYFLVH